MRSMIGMVIGLCCLPACATVPDEPERAPRVELEALGVSRSQSIMNWGKISPTTPSLENPVIVTSRWKGVVEWVTKDDPEVPNFPDFPYSDGLVEFSPGFGGTPMGEVIITAFAPSTRLIFDCIVSTGNLSAEIYDATGNPVLVTPLVVPYRVPSAVDPVDGWYVATVVTPLDVNPNTASMRMYMAPPVSPGDPVENWVLRSCEISTAN